MGIRGLTSFLKKQHPNIGKRATTFNTFIIDGSSFMYYVARQVNWLLGNNYLELEALLFKYLKLLQKVGNPIFIFDGAVLDYKVRERMERNERRLNIVSTVLEIATKNHYFGNLGLGSDILPVFATIVTINLLKRENAQVIWAVFEADHVIAHEAKKRNCPVISNDSDFYIFDIPGFIHLDTMDFQFDSDRIVYQICTRYDVAAALRVIPDHLPLFAVLCGNDHLDSEQYQDSVLDRFTWINKTKFKNISQILGRHKKTNVYNAISELCRADAQLKTAMNESWKQYTSFEIEKADSFVAKQILQGKFNQQIIEIYQNQRFWCLPFLDDISSSSCWAWSKGIRKLLYGIIDANVDITEHTPSGKHMTTDLVAPFKFNPPLKHNFISEAGQEEKMDLFCQIFYPIDEYQAIVTAVRFIIEQGVELDKQVANYEIVALICSCLKSTGNSSETAIVPSLNSIRYMAILESSLFSLLLLSQVLIDTDAKDFYPPPAAHFHKTYQQAKRGADPKKIVGSELYPTFLKLYKASTCKLEDSVDLVFEYNFSC